MDQTELLFAILIVLASMVIGFLFYIAFFNPWTAKLRLRFRGLLKKKGRGLGRK